MIHELKTEKGFFEDVISGIKNFEVRKDDRLFEVGDFLALNEINEDKGYTGRCCIAKVAYILRDERFVKEGYVIMGIQGCYIGEGGNNDPLNMRKKFKG